MNKKYPTKKEILRNKNKHKTETIKVVKEWKKMYYKNKWKEKKDGYKMIAIKKLLIKINKQYKTEKVKVKKGNKNQYIQQTHTIIIKSTSIVSALHELAHHIYGGSELKACRWSIWLFKKCFKKEFNSLKFKGHILIKK